MKGGVVALEKPMHPVASTVLEGIILVATRAIDEGAQ
jgi:hypothetical protein